jgi:uncharacterized protein
MKQALLSEASIANKFFFSLFIILISTFVFLILGTVLGIMIFDVKFSEITSILSDFKNTKTLALLKFMQIFQSIGIFIIPPIILGYFFHNNPIRYLKINIKPKTKSFFLTISIMIVALPLINLLGEINSNLSLPEFMSSIETWMKQKEADAMKITEAFLNVETYWGFAINIVMIAIIPGIGEELLFRGVLQRLFAEWFKNIHYGIILSALLFSAMHMQFYGFFPRMLMGILFGYLFYWSGSIWIPILAHFTNNVLAVIVSFYINKGFINEKVETIGNSSDSVIYALFSLLTISALILLFYRIERRLIR